MIYTSNLTVEKGWWYRIGAMLAMGGVVTTACRPSVETVSAAVASPENTPIIFPTASEVSLTEEIPNSGSREVRVVVEPTEAATELPIFPGEVLIGEEIFDGSSGRVERIGQTRFRLVFESGDSYYFVDESSEGIPPLEFEGERYLRFVDKSGRIYDLPLFLQHDPRWGLEKMGTGGRFFFGRRACGQAVAATIAALAGEMTDPLSFSLDYMPNWEGAIGTYPFVYRDIFELMGLTVNVIKNGRYGVEAEVEKGHLVMGLVRENFRWWGARESDNVVDHYILWYKDENGETRIWDPWWGTGVERGDIVEILAALAIVK